MLCSTPCLNDLWIEAITRSNLILRGDPCNIAGAELVSVCSDHVFPRHAHVQFGIGIIDQGAHRSWSGVGLVEAKQGDVIMVDPGEIHDGLPIARKPRSSRMVYLDQALVSSLLERETPSDMEIVRPAVTDAWLASRIRTLYALLKIGPSDPIELHEAFAEVMAAIAIKYSTTRAEVAVRPSLSVAKQWLDDKPDRAFSLEELASSRGLSRFQFLRAVKAAYHTTPHAHLVQRRVGLARVYLSRGMAPAEAAIQAGFSDQSHLTRCFVRQSGISPAKYACHGMSRNFIQDEGGRI